MTTSQIVVTRASGTPAVLGLRALGRATLARQALLERVTLDPVAAVERFGGLQAQEPASPYLALWTRLTDFDPADLDAAIRTRRVVKATLMRGTLHLVSAADYGPVRAAVAPTLKGLRAADGFRDANFPDVEAAADRAVAFADRPRTNAEIHAHLANLREASGRSGQDVWWRIRRHASFVHVPSDVPWSFGRRPAYIAARSWLGDPPDIPETAAVEALVRRYLGAFGPASQADIRGWSHVSSARLRPVIAAMTDLVSFRADSGPALLDLADAPRPDADVPAPPRFLPMWDSVLLGHDDRTRVLPAEMRGQVIARNGDVLPTFLIDGLVAGLWWAEPDGAGTRIVTEPFRPLPRAAARDLATEADALAAFLGPIEPAAYGRYRYTRARR